MKVRTANDATVKVPIASPLKAELVELATQHRRTLAAEIRHILRAHLRQRNERPWSRPPNFKTKEVNVGTSPEKPERRCHAAPVTASPTCEADLSRAATRLVAGPATPTAMLDFYEALFAEAPASVGEHFLKRDALVTSLVPLWEAIREDAEQRHELERTS